MRRPIALGVAIAMSSFGCSLDTEGVSFDDPPDAGADVNTGLDASPDVAGQDVQQPPQDAASDGVIDAPADVVSEPPPGSCTTPRGACVDSVAGWEVIAFRTDASSACPAGYATEDVQADPAIAAGACDCNCTITEEPCVSGTIPTYYSSSPGCGASGQSITIDGTGCIDIQGGSLSSYYRSPALPAGGACVGAPISDSSKLTTSAARVCAPPTECLEEICLGQPPAGLSACIRASGDVACPPGPFTQKHLLVDGATFTCTDCPTCSVSAQCNDPQIEFHSNNSCSNHVVTLPSNDTCVSTNGGGNVSSLRYLVNVQKSCNADGPKQAALAADNPVTVCCR